MKVKCYICGKEHEVEDMAVAYGGPCSPTSPRGAVWVCTDCLSQTGICDRCGGRYLLSAMQDIDGYMWCKPCVENYTAECDYCGRPYPITGMYHLANDDDYCPTCRHSHAVMCECCGEMYPENDEHIQWYDDVNGYLCDPCYDYEYVTCESCNILIPVSSAHFVDGSYYCDECVPSSGIRRYHDAPEIRYYSRGGESSWDEFFPEPFKGLGVELEIDNGLFVRDTIKDLATLHEEDELYYCHDGSLSDMGIEIITMPHTPEAFWEIRWKEILETCMSHGYTSHENGKCGLHIHFSRLWFGEEDEEQAEPIQNLIRLYEWRYSDFLKASRRGSTSHWAEPYLGGSSSVPTKEESSDLFKKYNKSYHSDRYRTINLTNEDTIEFRLGRGTLKYESFRAWIDLHIAIVRNCMRITDDTVQDLSEWFKGIEPETVEYLHSRGAFMDYSVKEDK